MLKNNQIFNWQLLHVYHTEIICFTKLIRISGYLMRPIHSTAIDNLLSTIASGSQIHIGLSADSLFVELMLLKFSCRVLDKHFQE